MNKKTKEILKDWVIIPFLGSLVLALLIEMRAVRTGDWQEYFESVAISCVYWSLLANGNAYFICLIDKKYTWLEAPVKRTILGVVTMFLVTIIISTIVLYVFLEFYYGIDFIKVWQHDGLLIYAIPLSITLVISLWLHGRSFLFEWRDAATKVERLNTENIKSKFESLRNQVNPHFLFNSLNALSSLVYDDQKRAVEFIQKLSEVYRYVLDTQKEEIVPISEEVNFLKSFVFLNKIRFGENLQVEIRDLDSLSIDHVIPPVSLQMLVENCLKHNEISKDRKLSIQVYQEEDYVVVKNNINEIQRGKSESSGLGLPNIQMRYEILTDQEVIVEQSDSNFMVKIPILTLDQ